MDLCLNFMFLRSNSRTFNIEHGSSPINFHLGCNICIILFLLLLEVTGTQTIAGPRLLALSTLFARITLLPGDLGRCGWLLCRFGDFFKELLVFFIGIQVVVVFIIKLD